MIEPPRGWVRATLGDVVDDARPGFPSGRHNVAGNGIPHLRPMNVSRDGRIDLEVVKYVEDGAGARIQRGEVLFNNTNSPDLVGKTAFFDRAGVWAYSNHMTRLRPSRAIDGRFLATQLHWLWMTGFFKTILNNHVNQASVATKSLLANVRVLVPPLAEQKRIVAAIEEHLSRLDAAVADLARAEASIALFRNRVLDSLTATDAPRMEVGSLVPSGRKIAYGVLQPGPHVVGGVPLVRVGDIDGFRVDSELKCIDPSVAARYPRTCLRGDEVLLTVVGTIGRTAVAPPDLRGANVARAVAVIPLMEDADARYVALALGSPASARRLTLAAHEVARKTLNLEDVRRFEIPLPSIDQQRAIADEVDAALGRVGTLADAVERAIHRGESLRLSILTRAFGGELLPQSSDDVPASVLLERVAGERAKASKPTRTRRERASA